MTAQPGLCQTWSENPKTGFLTHKSFVTTAYREGDSGTKVQGINFLICSQYSSYILPQLNLLLHVYRGGLKAAL